MAQNTGIWHPGIVIPRVLSYQFVLSLGLLEKILHQHLHYQVLQNVEMFLDSEKKTPPLLCKITNLHKQWYLNIGVANPECGASIEIAWMVFFWGALTCCDSLLIYAGTAVDSLVVRASDSRPEGLGSKPMPPNILRVHTEYVLIKSVGPKVLWAESPVQGTGEYFPPLQFHV
ncbi:UNVERIFIED_CONTAM: hypothetical protein NCL1_49928 [Trichonephila clavipes]